MLEVENLSLFFENITAINNVSVKCAENQTVGIFGTNGAGKSSLMYAISGLIFYIKEKEEMRGGERITLLGKITLDGEDITYLKANQKARRGIVLCPERRRLFYESSVLENLKVGAYLRSRQQSKKMLNYIFTIFPALVEIQKRETGFLSGGEQQMVAIGRALMSEPRLLLLDEPLLGLSPTMQSSLVKTIRRIREASGISILIAEQYARPLMPIVEYAYIIENGTSALEGTGKELLSNPDVKSAYFGI
jgi:branched-chain amino acid transport system ATP-binding protein